eukprot:scaffold19157_cov33-Phaeocystis_antarctica.AAC.1
MVPRQAPRHQARAARRRSPPRAGHGDRTSRPPPGQRPLPTEHECPLWPCCKGTAASDRGPQRKA